MGFDRRSIFFAPVAMTVLVAQPAWAEPNAAERETARALMNDGDRKFEAKSYQEALRNYQGAHAIMGVPSTGYAVAKTQAALGLLVEARDSAVMVTRMPAKAGEPAPFTRSRVDAEKLARELAGRIGALQIVVEGPSAGTALEVDVDRVPVPTAVLRLGLKTNPGKHIVHASAPGYVESSKDVTLREAETATVPLALEPSKPSATSPRVVAGASLGTSHEHPVDEAAGNGLPPLVWVGFGTGAAGIIVGTVAGVVHLAKVSSVKTDYCNGGTGCNPGFEEARDSAKPSATISTIGFAVGAVGIGVGVIGLVTSKRSSGATGVWMAPSIGLGSFGAVGRF
jgi:hypothetical protein